MNAELARSPSIQRTDGRTGGPGGRGARSRVTARMAVLCIALILVVPSLPSGPAGAGSVVEHGAADFRNGTLNTTVAGPEGITLPIEIDAPYKWTKLNNGEPYPMWGPAFEWDSNNDKMVLLGSDASSDWYYYGDTWTYDPRTDKWEAKNPTIAPMIRQSGYVLQYVRLFNGI